MHQGLKAGDWGQSWNAKGIHPSYDWSHSYKETDGKLEFVI